MAYVIISLLYFFNETMFESRVGLIMSALFACVGNKYTVDISLPSTDVFTLSDLIQVASFVIVGIGLFSSVMVVLLTKKGLQQLAYRIDLVVTWAVIIAYPSVIYYGVLMAPQ